MKRAILSIEVSLKKYYPKHPFSLKRLHKLYNCSSYVLSCLNHSNKSIFKCCFLFFVQKIVLFLVHLFCLSKRTVCYVFSLDIKFEQLAKIILRQRVNKIQHIILPLIEILKFDWLRLYPAISCFLTNLIFLIYPLHVTY